VDDGMGTFVVKYGTGIPACLNSRVTEVRYASGGVEVKTAAGTYRASNALITVSAGVLAAAPPKGIAFDPGLPATKKSAISQLEMGNLQKVIIPFRDDIFGDARVNSWVLTKGDLPVVAQRFAHDRRLPLVDGKGLVMAFVMKP